MMRRGVEIGSTRYASKEAVREVCRRIVRQYGVDGEVTDAVDDAFLRELIALHPEYEVKRGPGIAHFRIIASQWGGKSAGLAVVQYDGSVVDFSWNACLTPPSHRAQVLGALRRLVAPQVIEARDGILRSGKPLVCSVTGAAIPSLDELHMDHADPTFLTIAEDFITSQGGLDAFRIRPEQGARISYAELEDHILRDRWQDYHEETAVLRPVLRRVNLSDLRRSA
jgi:hypothetical protein